MKYFNLLLAVYLLLAGCSQEASDRQMAGDDLAYQVIAEKAEQKKKEEEQRPKVESVGQTAGERIVEAYLLSDTAKDRSRFVLDPKKTLPRMEKYYAERSIKGIEVDEISRVDGQGDPKAGKYGKYRVGYTDRRDRKRTTAFFVKNTRDGLKIDWKATTGFNEMSWRAFKTTMPTKPTTMRAEAKLSSYYGFDFEDAARTHYSMFLSDAVVLYGFVRKNSRAGKQIYNILKDGETHNITLKVRYVRGADPNGITAQIDDIVSEDWLIR